jgi:hypothetical protein
MVLYKLHGYCQAMSIWKMYSRGPGLARRKLSGVSMPTQVVCPQRRLLRLSCPFTI